MFKKKKSESWLRDNVEAVATAVALAMLIRLFAVEAFVIPTGSMAPTLRGEHISLTCPNCGTEVAIAFRGGFEKAYLFETISPHSKKDVTVVVYGSDLSFNEQEVVCPDSGKSWYVRVSREKLGKATYARRYNAICPVCNWRFKADVVPSDVCGGDKIFVNKLPFLLREPQRWEVIVFKCPQETTKNYIKRLIGLGGETVQIKGGEIYIDGKMARKPRWARRAVATLVYSSELKEKFKERSVWQIKHGAWRFEEDGFSVQAGSEPNVVEYGGDITARVPYNEPDSDSGQPVSDVTLEFRVKANVDGSVEKNYVLALLGDGTNEAVLYLATGRGRSLLRFNCDVVAESEFGLSGGGFHSVEFSKVDNRVEVYVDGKMLFAYEYETETTGRNATIRIGAQGVNVFFKDVRIWRDIYYYARMGGYGDESEPERVPLDSYFVLGDNSENSNDSRVWGSVPSANLMGKAFLVFWPPKRVHFVK
ncbi:MAG: signal peptidase I [Planctomycetota bacterium]|nr:signal peptidase I [Planctomycetota bacterium]